MWNPESWILACSFLLGTGWYGGGSSALHDHSDAVSNGGPLGLNTVGTSQMRTATGSFLGADNGPQIAMNDYAFSYNTFDPGAAGAPMAPINATDPTNTIARISINGNGANNIHLQWRYLTASDDPTIWVAADLVTGKIAGVWCADDPISKEAEIPGVTYAGLTSVKFNAAELAVLNLPAGALVLADAYIIANKLNPAHRLYRALQEHAGDPAPAGWILKNCQLDAGGKLALTAGGLIDVATLDSPAKPSFLARIWQGVTKFFVS